MQIAARPLVPAVFSLLLAMNIGGLRADVIARYDMATLNIAGTTSTSPDVAAKIGVTAGDFTENLTGGTAQGEFGIRSNGLIPAGVNGLSARTLNNSPTNPWWEFTITPDPGVTLTLTSLTLDVGVSTTLNSTMNWDFHVSTSIDDFASTVGTFDGPVTTTNASATELSVDLSSLAPQTTSFTIRITPNRVAGTNGAATQRAGWIDNVTLNATTAGVPDPILVVEDVSTFTAHNTTVALSIPVSNGGATQALSITALTPGGADASNIVITTPLPLEIPAGGSSTIDFNFIPNGTFQADYSATLDVVSTDAENPSKVLILDITNQPDPWISALPQDFTNDGLAMVYSFDVENLGLANSLNLTGITVGGPDGPATVTAPTINTATIPAGTTAADAVSFTFTPDSGSGFYDITFTLASNDPEMPDLDVNITVEVQDPLISAPSSLDFGNFANNPGTQTEFITISNVGGSLPLNVTELSLAEGTRFSIVTATPFAIAAGDRAVVEVGFHPGTTGGRFTDTLSISSNDYFGKTSQVKLAAFVDPAGTVVSRFDFDPDQGSGTIVDLDGTGQTDWATGSLTDEATGNGALSSSNQGTFNRNLAAGLNGNYLRFSSNRESDAQTPLATGGNNESTWTKFTVTPDAGGGSIDFTGGTAVVDTYANTDQGTNTAADWTLYYSTDGGTTWTSLGTSAGQSTAVNGTFGPLGLSWDLSSLGNQTGPVDFILDPVSTGATNGSAAQRGVGFDNLVISAGSVIPGPGGSFSTWASGFGIPNHPAYDGSDNDGIPALVEYALGFSPLVSEGSPGTLTGSLLSFTKGAEAVTNGDVTYAIETSQNLTTWDPATPDAENATTLSYTLPAAQGKWFARLVVTQVVP